MTSIEQTTPKRILCTGITAIHTWPAFCALLENESHEVFGIKPPKAKVPSGPNIFSASLNNPEDYKKIFEEVQPTHVLHAAGVCDLDGCEADPARAHRINVDGAALIRELSHNAYLMYCSADLVFSGVTPPQEGYAESHVPDPVSVVGKTYLLAEKEIEKHPRSAIVRMGLPMGPSIQGSKAAVDWIEGRFKKNRTVTLFYDEYRSAIHTDDVGEIITQLFNKEVTGLYHAGGPRPVSLYEMGDVISQYCETYDKSLLKGRYTHEEKNGPPRVKNVHMDSSRVYSLLGWTPKLWPERALSDLKE
ncbi:MAG: sugar nucleotide-binding protein [Fibrobacterales bacterium]